MKIPSTKRPNGYSGIATGTPRIITTVSASKTSISSVPVAHALTKVDLDVDVEDEIVETAVKPGTNVVEVDVVVEVEAKVVVVAQACIGVSDLTLGIEGVAKAKTAATTNAYFTQAVPNLMNASRSGGVSKGNKRACLTLDIGLRGNINLLAHAVVLS